MGSVGGISLGTLSITIQAAVDEALAAIQGFGADVGRVIDEQKQKWDGLAQTGQQLTSLGTSLSVLSAAFVAVGGVSVKAAADMQSLTLGLEAVEGSADAAGERLASLREIAKMPGLALPEAVAAYTRLRAVGASAGDAETYLKVFGNALATVGKGAPDLDAVITQLTQMSSKTQVVAGDLRPIMERVPQVAAIIKEAYGTIDTEKLQKAGVDTKEFIGVMIAGLQQLAPFSGGLANSFENLKDATTKALSEIGAAFAPIVTAVIPILETLLGWIGQAATKFTELPGPVQTFALALGGIAIAIGPLILLGGQFAVAIAALAPILEGVAVALGVSSLALGGWVIAIAAGVAALAAFGAWVYEHWDGISKVLTEAWDKLTAIWGSTWTTIVDTVLGIWNTFWAAEALLWGSIAAVAMAVWDGVAAFWSGVWTGIIAALTTIWSGFTALLSIFDAIAGVLNPFWEPIKQAWMDTWNAILGFIGPIWDKLSQTVGVVTGAFKALGTELTSTGGKHDDAATAAKKHAAQEQAAADAADKKSKWEELKSTLTNLSDQHGKTGASANKLKSSVKAAGDAAADADDKFKKLTDRNEILDAMAAQLSASHKKLAGEIAAAKLAGHDLTAEFEKLDPAMTNANVAAGAYQASLTAIATDGLPKVLDKLGQFQHAIEPATGSIAAMNQGLKDLGITSAAEFQNLADKAQAAYDKVIAAPDASKWEQDSALLKLLTAQRKAMEANGEEIPKLMDKQMSDLKTSVEGKAPEIKGAFDGMMTSVSTVITNFAQDAAKSLWEGDTSWGEKGKALLKSLGQAVTSSFIEPATKALSDFISGALKALLGGDGFEGVLSAVKGIGEAVTNIFSGGSKVASAAGGAGGGGGGAGGIAGGIASGALGWANLGVSILSGVVDFFQTSEMNKTLDTIGKHTLQTANDMANLRADDWDRHGQYGAWKDDYITRLNSIMDNVGLATLSVQAIEQQSFDASNTLADMLGDSRRAAPAAATFMDKVVNLLSGIAGKLDGLAAGQQMTMQLYGTDPSTVASKIATQMRLQGGVA